MPAFDAFAAAAPHPAWVTRDFPSYAAGGHAAGGHAAGGHAAGGHAAGGHAAGGHAAGGHAAGGAASTRVLYAGGHAIEITTTYSVSIDGRVVPVHMMVDSDGQLWSHLCPYRTFGNATDLLRYLVERVPDALAGIELGGHQHEHGGAAS